MDKLNLNQFKNDVVGFASNSYILSQVLNLKSDQERALAELAVLWGCSLDQATTKAQKISTNTCYSLSDIVLRVKCGVRFPD